MMSSVFKYILIAIVGVVVLLFFISFAFRHADTEEAISAIVIAQTIDDTFEAFTISPNLATEINLNREVELNVECNKISLKNQRQVDMPRVIFSPRTLKGNKIITFTQSWDFPFKITNFYYLTNLRTKTYLVYDSQTQEFVEAINETIPSKMRVEMLHFSSLGTQVSSQNTQNYDLIKLAFFSTDTSSPRNQKIKRIKLEPKEQGKVIFLDEQNKQEEYISKEMLIGAIFSEDYESYKCSKDKAMEKLGIISDLYIGKTDLLSKKKTMCTKFDDLIRLLKDLKNPSPSTSTLSNLISANRDLAGDRNCVSIF